MLELVAAYGNLFSLNQVNDVRLKKRTTDWKTGILVNGCWTKRDSLRWSRRREPVKKNPSLAVVTSSVKVKRINFVDPVRGNPGRRKTNALAGRLCFFVSWRLRKLALSTRHKTKKPKANAFGFSSRRKRELYLSCSLLFIRTYKLFKF
jgi:hypothetical protein